MRHCQINKFQQKGEILTNNFKIFTLAVLIILVFNTLATAGGLFGPPQTVSKETGGLNTAIGYFYHEDTFNNDTDRLIRQNSIYSQVAYGSKNMWEIYGRIGVSDLKIFDVFSSTDNSTTTNKLDFEDNWKFFGTLGAKGFYPISKIFGIGAFIQGTYHFSNYTDGVTGSNNGTPYVADLKIKNLWDINFGMGFQLTAPLNIKLYAGPYVYYSEAKASLDTNIPGIEYAAGNVSISNKSIVGGFAGVDIPLFKGFHLNVEGQYADRLSAGAAISYTY
jgi:hypothetical protein